VTPVEHVATFERDGFTVITDVVDDVRCDDLLRLLPEPDEPAKLRRLLDLPLVAELAKDLLRNPRVASLSPPEARPVQCTFFDKSSERNWSVGPHQDLSLPLPAGMQGLPDGWRGASRKDGLEFGQPPAALLEQVLAIRVQLDPIEADDGVLEVIPGTHRRGRLDALELESLAQTAQRVPCPLSRGSVLLLRPLLVHASRRLQSARRRRLLHFVFAPREAT
jgi:hypothetical protein